MKLENNLGVYPTFEELWQKYPSGGKEGDYVVVDNKVYCWNKYVSQWVLPETADRQSEVRKTETVYGDMHVHHDLSVGGILRARVVRGRNAFCGLFASVLALNLHYTEPYVGQWALVAAEHRTDDDGNAIGDIYMCVKDGEWKNTGLKGGYDNSLYEALQTEREERIEIDANLIALINNEIDARKNADKILQSNIDAEARLRDDEDKHLLKRIQGTAEDSKPYEDPFKLVQINSEAGTPMEAFNAWLDNLHPVNGQTYDEKKTTVGFFRVIAGGLQYEVHNFIASWGANRCRQVLHGIVSVSESGKIQGGARYNMLQRDYDGQKWSEWEPVGGTLRTASINGKPLPVSGSNVNLNTGKGLQVESGDTLTLKLGTGMRYGADGELISDVTASDKEELQNANDTITKSITQLKQDVKTQKDDLLHRIQGTAEDSKPYEDPFKLVQINSEAGTPMEAFNAWLDNLHPVNGQTHDEKKTTVGFFRVIAGGLQYEVHNFIASWGENTCNQVLLGIVNKDANGAITWGARYNILQRSYNGTEWSEWTSVIGGNMNMQLGTGLKLGTDGKIYVDISAIMNI